MRVQVTLAVIAMTVLLAGCSANRISGSYTTGESHEPAQRDVAASHALTEQARELLESDVTQAEKLLREALDLDLYNGVAHNNLGVIFLKADRLYDAAQEFEWARKLLPGHPDPRLNLAIALQRAERPREALEAARAALEAQPGHLGATQAIASIQISAGMDDDKTIDMLKSITERSPEAEWRSWATESRIRLESRIAQP